jgi:hypothetical protein
LNLATPVVDARPKAPSGTDPLKVLLTTYDVHIPISVVGELSETTGGDDLLATAADLVLRGAHHLTTHDIDDQDDDACRAATSRSDAAAAGSNAGA